MDKLEIIKNKIRNRDELLPLLSRWRFKDRKLVFTNGCFDILHRGHIEYLAKASGLGDRLIVGVNTDESVRKIKGNDRPAQDEYSRALAVSSLYFVDLVVLFGEDTPYDLIKFIEPDVLVKGGDYFPEEIVGRDIVASRGGDVVTIELIEGYSTSDIIEKLSNKM